MDVESFDNFGYVAISLPQFNVRIGLIPPVRSPGVLADVVDELLARHSEYL